MPDKEYTEPKTKDKEIFLLKKNSCLKLILIIFYRYAIFQNYNNS